MRAVFDTNILIDLLGRVPQANQTLRAFDEWSISPITWIEVLSGARNAQDEGRIRALLGSFQLEPLTPLIAERAALIRQRARMKLPDAIILATAEDLACPLLTRNTKDFSPDDPLVRIPYTL